MMTSDAQARAGHPRAAREDHPARSARSDADNAPPRPQALGNPPRQALRPTPDVEHARSVLEPEPLDQALASFELEVAHPIVDSRRSSGKLDTSWLTLAVRTVIAGARAGVLVRRRETRSR
jgi:hypothetical protein